MIYVIPSCFDGFSCIGSRCPDTCCSGWRVDLDPEILKVYESMKTPLGTEIRSKIIRGEDGACFEMEQGRCPFLNQDKLCRLILEQGEEILSVTCREHPRFRDEYGIMEETCLSISCPEAAKMLLNGTFQLKVEKQGAPGKLDPDLDPDMFRNVYTIREQLMARVVETQSLNQCIAELLELFPDYDRPTFQGYLTNMVYLEYTDDRLNLWAQDTMRYPPEQVQLEERITQYSREAGNLLLYFLYRYVLRAVWDGMIYEKVGFAIYSLWTIFSLAIKREGDFADNLLWAAILYSREVEHSPDNLDIMIGAVEI